MMKNENIVQNTAPLAKVSS